MSKALYIDLEWMREAYRRTYRDAATGIDRQTTEQYETNLDENLRSLLDRFKSGRYCPPQVIRAHIPEEKKSGKEHPVGIPILEDEILQRAVVILLEPLYEKEFNKSSYGFRPKGSAQMALKTIWHAAMDMKGCWLFEVDIRKYFDPAVQSHIQTFVKRRVCNRVITRIIGKWLKAGVMEQEGVISLMLCNVYLHEVLDKWLEEQIAPRLQGRTKLVRFANDFIILFDNEENARKVGAALPLRFERYGVVINPERMRLVAFSKPRDDNKTETFDFLGFTHFWGTSRKGNSIVLCNLLPVDDFRKPTGI